MTTTIQAPRTTEIAAVELYKFIATHSDEWRKVRSVDDHLQLYQRCARVVRFRNSSLDQIDQDQDPNHR